VEDLIGVLALVLLFGVIPLSWAMRKPLLLWLAQRERREARQLYERLTLEKLDVIKTAVSMGMDKTDLAELDLRLKKLIGADQLQSLLQDAPRTPADEALGAFDLDVEQQRAVRRRAERQ
jgi:hypothetical protein